MKTQLISLFQVCKVYKRKVCLTNSDTHKKENNTDLYEGAMDSYCPRKTQ